MKQFRVFLLVCLAPSLSFAAPLVTILCDIPKGSQTEYGVSSFERVQAKMDNKPLPKSHLKGPKVSGYEEKPTFIVDSGKKELAVIWSESATELNQKKKAKELGMPYCCSPNPISEAKIVTFTPDHISAIEITQPQAVTMYSFFPKLGTAFITSQGIDVFGMNASQGSFFSTCEFSWNNQH